MGFELCHLPVECTGRSGGKTPGPEGWIGTQHLEGCENLGIEKEAGTCQVKKNPENAEYLKEAFKTRTSRFSRRTGKVDFGYP